MKVNLNNKRVLYMGPVFFPYDQFLLNKLKELGALVEPFELYLTGLHYKFIKKFRPSEVEDFKRNYYRKAFVKNNYDYVLVRHGYQLSPAFYDQLRTFNPSAKFINFHWDSVKEHYDYRSIIKCFDRVYSFDYKDCETYSGLSYLPLFFIDLYSNFAKESVIKANNKNYDLLFIGAWRNMERYNMIKLTEEHAQQAGLNFYYYLHLSLKDQLVSIKEGTYPKESKSRLLTHKNILRLLSVSNTVIDFPSSFQTGLTMRTFETLGAGKKLITTNKNIFKEPFYDPEFIDVIDTKEYDLHKDFINNIPARSLKDKMNNYSLESYIYKLLA